MNTKKEKKEHTVMTRRADKRNENIFDRYALHYNTKERDALQYETHVCIYEVFTGNRSRHHRSQVCSGIVGSVRLCLSHRLPLTSQRPGSWWEKTSTPVW